MSESELPIEIEFEDGIILRAVLNRVAAPLIIEEIKSKMPIEGRAALLRGEMKITMALNKGNLKPTKEVKRGNIAYMPLGDSLCIYLRDMTTFSPVNILGQVSDEKDLSILERVRRGSRAIIKTS
ncbi:MAG: hypothetical protein EAX95_09510 [Candidatus Thorarchaeota archaeon]|nr:hypothetical protein [Candidatus Thorarchaeota archaeon]